MGEVLLFAPKAHPDVEWYLETPERTDTFCSWFLEKGIMTKDEFNLFSWKMKRDFVRMYLNNLKTNP